MSRLLEVEQLTLEMGGKQVCQQLEWQVQQGEVWGCLGSTAWARVRCCRRCVGYGLSPQEPYR